MTLKGRIDAVMRHPSVIYDIIRGRSRDEIRAKIRTADENEYEARLENECSQFISDLKKSLPRAYPKDLKLNKLCCIEDWENREISELVSQLQSSPYYEKSKGMLARAPGQIHRKDWEWAMGVLAMRRLGKLNKKSAGLGIGAGKELVLFYLANHAGHVYATDLYGAQAWENFAPSDFPENPAKYAPFSYDECALSVSRMDATRLGFRPCSFDAVFSFSSIEHFGGENHSGALSSMKEVERVLKPGGIAVIATEYIINGKEPPDLTNQFYNVQTIYSDLIDKLEALRLVEPLDLTITARTLDTVMDVRDAEKWDRGVYDDGYRKAHPYILLRTGNILLTSVMLVFQKS